MFELTPEVYEMQVNYELNDLHSSQVLLPLQRMEKSGQESMVAPAKMQSCLLTQILAPLAVA